MQYSSYQRACGFILVLISLNTDRIEHISTAA